MPRTARRVRRASFLAQLSEPLEPRFLLSAGPEDDPPDLSPLSISGLTGGNGVFTANNPTISFNNVATLALQGTVTVSNNQISATGQVSAAFGGNQLLFGGTFTIPIGTAATTALNDTLGDVVGRLQLGGTKLTFQNIALGAGSVTFDASAKLPPALGSFELNATQVAFSASGISAATLGVNDPNTYQFNLGGFKLNAQQLSANYDVQAQKVKLNGVFNAPQLNATVNLAGNKFIAIGAGPTIEFAGGVSINGPVTIGGPWKLNSCDLNVSYQNDAFTTSGTAVVDTGGGNLNLQASFANNAFNFSVQGQAMFQLLGMDLTISSLNFTSDQSGGGAWDPKLTIQGSLKLPQQFGDFTVAIDGTNTLTVDSTGVSITGGTATFPGNQTFTILGLLEIKSQNATLAFDFANSEVKLQGTFIVPTLNNLQINLSGNNFAALKFANDSLDFAMMGSFSNITIPIYQQWQLQNGSLTINKPYGTIPGDISAAFEIKTPNNTTIALAAEFMNGRLKEVTVTNNNSNPDFTFFGVSANVQRVKFIPDINPGNDDEFEPQLELQGSVSLPTSFGTITSGPGSGGPVKFEVADPEKFILNESSITLTGGSISIPNVNFNLLGLVKVAAQGLNVRFNSTPTQSLRISGIVKIPQLYNLTLNFDPAQNRYVQIDSAGNVSVNGSVSVSNVPIVAPVWVIRNATFTFNNTGPQTVFQVDATLKIPSGALVGGKIRFVGGDLDAITLFADNLRVPLGATGVFLTRIDGGLQNLANPSGNPPLKFTGGMGLSFGPRITAPLPQVLGGPLTGSLIDLTVNGSIDRNQLIVNGDMAIVGNSRPHPPAGLATGSASMTLNWNRGVFQGDMQISVLGGFFVSNVRAIATSDGSFQLSGTGQVRVPDGIQYFGGIGGPSGDGVLSYTNNNTLSDDFVAAWISYTVPIPAWAGGPYTLTKGLRVFFDGRYELIHSEVELPPIVTNLEKAEYDINAGTSRFVVTADWQNSGLNPDEVRVQFFNPTTQQLVDVTQPNNGIVDAVNITAARPGNRSFTLAGIHRTGRYVFTLVPPTGQLFTNTRWAAGIPNEKPQINITSATTGQNLSDVTINYVAADPDNIAKIKWFVDTDNQGFDGQQIKVVFQGQPTLVNDELDRADSVLWKSAQPINSQGFILPSGQYFIYAVIDDGTNAPVFKYFNTPVTVDTNDNPHPVAVRVGSTAWNQRFINDLIRRGIGDELGFTVYESGGEVIPSPLDARPLPWGNIDRLIVRVNKPVEVPEDAARLFGVATLEYPVTIQPDGDEVNIVIEVPQLAAAERLLLQLAATITGKYDESAFDGNNDRTSGDAANLAFNLLQGDANRDGVVNLADFAMLAGAFFSTADGPTGFSSYNPLVDFDGSGAINVIDFAYLARNFNNPLPPPLRPAGGEPPRPPFSDRAAIPAQRELFSTKLVPVRELIEETTPV